MLFEMSKDKGKAPAITQQEMDLVCDLHGCVNEIFENCDCRRDLCDTTFTIEKIAA